MVSLEWVLDCYKMLRWESKGDLARMYATISGFLNMEIDGDNYERMEMYRRVQEIVGDEIIMEYMKQHGYTRVEGTGKFEKEQSGNNE